MNKIDKPCYFVKVGHGRYAVYTYDARMGMYRESMSTMGYREARRIVATRNQGLRAGWTTQQIFDTEYNS